MVQATRAATFQIADPAEFSKIIDTNAVFTTNATINTWLEGPVWVPSGGGYLVLPATAELVGDSLERSGSIRACFLRGYRFPRVPMVVQESEDSLLQGSLLFGRRGINPDEVTKETIVMNPTTDLSNGLFDFIMVRHATPFFDLCVNCRKRRI